MSPKHPPRHSRPTAPHDAPRYGATPAADRNSTPHGAQHTGDKPAAPAHHADGQRVSHDQNFKNLIVQYPRQALQFFAPSEADGIDQQVKITPIRQEQLKPYLGDSFFELDVPLLLEWPDGRREALIFIVEHESDPGRFRITRLASYCLAVAEAMETARVVPVVIFMRDSPNIAQHITLGSEHTAYLQFRYIACILPRLPAMAHLTTNNVVAALMLPLMQYAREHRVTVYGEAHRSLRRLEPDPANRRKYIDFIDIYAALDDEEQQRYKERYVEEGKEMMGMRERFQQEGRQQGLQQGVQQGLLTGHQQMLAELLTGRFGPLDAKITARIASASLDELRGWTRQILTARTLDEVFRPQ